MSERQWTCGGCGKTGIQTTSGTLRKWCSEKCRKDTLYSDVCVDCGKRVWGDTKGPVERRCVPCVNKHWAVTGIRLTSPAAVAAKARRERIVEMWASGMLVRAIAAEFDWTIGRASVEMVRMRELGYDLPYRYAKTRREASRAAQYG